MDQVTFRHTLPRTEHVRPDTDSNRDVCLLGFSREQGNYYAGIVYSRENIPSFLLSLSKVPASPCPQALPPKEATWPYTPTTHKYETRPRRQPTMILMLQACHVAHDCCLQCQPASYLLWVHDSDLRPLLLPKPFQKLRHVTLLSNFVSKRCPLSICSQC